MDNLCDELLWENCLKGDDYALEQLYRRYYPRLYAYGCKISADRNMIQNIIQDLFVKIIIDRRKLPVLNNVNAYLFLAFRRRLFGSGKDKQTVFINDLSLMEDMYDTYEESQTLNEQIRKMYKAYRKLSSKQRRIVYLYYICKMGHDEIANVLDINYQSSKNMLHRSLVKLRTLFFNEDG